MCISDRVPQSDAAAATAISMHKFNSVGNTQYAPAAMYDPRDEDRFTNTG